MKFPKFLLILFLFFSCTNEKNTDLPLDKDLDKAEQFFANKDFKNAYRYYQKSLDYNIENEIKKRQIYCLLKLAEIEKNEYDFANSEATITKAIKLFNKETSIDYKIFAYNMLSVNYTNANDHINALKTQFLIDTITTDSLQKLSNKNNIAYVYLKMGKKQKALDILNKIKNDPLLLKDSVFYARVLHNIGVFKFKNEEDGLKEMQEALTIREKVNDSTQLLYSYMDLSEYFKDKNFQKSYDYALKSYTLSKKYHFIEDQLTSLSYLIETSSTNQLKDNYFYTYKFKNDSLQLARQTAKNQFAKIKYDKQKIEEENNKNKRIKIIYGSISLILLLIGGLIYRIISLKNKRKIQETAYLIETKIAKKLHDELANDLHNTITLTELDATINENFKDKLLTKLDDIYKRIRDISNQNALIDTSTNYYNNLKLLLYSYLNPNRNIIIKENEINFDKIQSNKKIVIYRVLQELLVNMSKHSNATLVVIKIECVKNLNISYSDNGVGVNLNDWHKKGLKNTEIRIQNIKGTITFDSELGKGFKVNIEIPI